MRVGRLETVWRHVPDWPQPAAWLCSDFLLEFDETLRRSIPTLAGDLRRRGDALLFLLGWRQCGRTAQLRRQST